MKIQLTIKATYLPTWGSYEGIRELIQNARDASVDGHPMKIDHVNGTTLRIETQGVTLSPNVLLFGHTSKEGRENMIGKFGEGLKLGLLALVRSGHKVKVRNGGSVWTPGLEMSDTFQEQVLAILIVNGRENKNRFRVEIEGVSTRMWEEFKACFRFLSPDAKDAVVCPSGTLLKAPEECGRVYVKGIYVATHHDLNYGYDFSSCELDRDRKMVSTWDLRWTTRSIVAEAATRSEATRPQLMAMLLSDAKDVEAMEHGTFGLDEETRHQVVTDFKERFGENAVPVATLAESNEVEHLGKKGVVVPKALSAVLATVMGSTNQIKENLLKETSKTYSWNDLLPLEMESLLDAFRLVRAVRPGFDSGIVDVVDMRSADIQGQFKDGRVLLSRKVLSDPNETLSTLVHEVTHDAGIDGTTGHVKAMQNLWKDITAFLRGTRYFGKAKSEIETPHP